jgi:hypothetical protein
MFLFGAICEQGFSKRFRVSKREHYKEKANILTLEDKCALEKSPLVTYSSDRKKKE